MQLANMLEIILERRLKPRGMGATALRFGGIFVPVAREVIEMLYEFDLPFVANGSAASTYLGIEATPLDRALAATVEWYRKQSNTTAVPA
jgi:nucleoside-diphosphate-sugar epimerase